MTRTITIRSVVTTIAATTLVAMTSSALAETDPADHHIADTMPAIKGGLEIAVAGNTARTVGDIGDGMDAADTIGTAGEVDLQIGYRVTPHLAIGFYATAQAFAQTANAERDVYTGSSGIEADFHFRPNRSIDPWLGIGAGVRALLVDADGKTLLVGAELARIQLGADFRLDDNFAIGPVIGASATLYGAEKAPMHDFEELASKGINWTLSLGIAGRFNAFGSRH